MLENFVVFVLTLDHIENIVFILCMTMEIWILRASFPPDLKIFNLGNAEIESQNISI